MPNRSYLPPRYDDVLAHARRRPDVFVVVKGGIFLQGHTQAGNGAEDIAVIIFGAARLEFNLGIGGVDDAGEGVHVVQFHVLDLVGAVDEAVGGVATGVQTHAKRGLVLLVFLPGQDHVFAIGVDLQMGGRINLDPLILLGIGVEIHAAGGQDAGVAAHENLPLKIVYRSEENTSEL